MVKDLIEEFVVFNVNQVQFIKVGFFVFFRCVFLVFGVFLVFLGFLVLFRCVDFFHSLVQSWMRCY